MNPVSESRTEFLDPGYLTIVNGRIESLAAEDPRGRFPDARFIDRTGFTLLPGFVDTHVHLPQFAIIGIGSNSLLEWLRDYTYPEESRFSEEDYARRISEKFFAALLANGTTTACVYCSVHERATAIAFEAAASLGLRAFIGKVMMDRNAPPDLLESTAQSLAAAQRLYNDWNGRNDGRLRYVFSPRFAGCCSAELLRAVARLAAERDAFIQSHLSENLDEVRWIRSLFPERTSYADVYADAGLLGGHTIMGHCIHLTDPEIRLLAKTATRVAYCPYSNRTLRSGIMPYAALKHAGLQISLGSDAAGGPSLSMFRQMGEALNSAHAAGSELTPAGALYLATRAGAETLDIADHAGSLSPGRDADFIVVDHRLADPLRATGSYNSPEHILSRLCYNGDSSCIQEVYLRGERQPGL